jgi:HEAT repeat protein
MTAAPQQTQVGVFTIDVDLVVSSWDIWMARATGLPEDQVRGRPLLTLFPEIESRGLAARLRKVIADGTVDVLAPAFHQYLISCPTTEGGTQFDRMQQHVTLSPIREHGAIHGVIVTIEDVTARFVSERMLSEQLKSDDEVIRLRATRQLSEQNTGAPPIDALGDTSWQVRRAAVGGFADQTTPDAIAQLIEIVRNKHTDLATLNASLSALTLAKQDSLPHLLALLDSDDANVRMYTALALGNMQDARAVPRLIALIEDRDLNVAYHAIEALGRIGSSAAVEPLLRVVRVRDPYLSFAALDAIAAIGEPAAMPDVIALIDDAMIGTAAIDTLAAIGNEQAAPPLAAAFATSDAPTSVCNALARIHDRLQQDYGEGELIADMVRIHIDPVIASRIVSTIPQATDAELPGVARVLGWLRFPGVEGTLCSLLAHKPSRLNAQEALVAFGPRAVPCLIDSLKDDAPEVRQAAAAVLGRIGGAESVKALVDVLDNDVPEVIVAAAAALGSIGSPAAFDQLVPLLGHTDAAVRHAAVSAINSVAHPETSRRIRTLLTNSNSLVREGAVKVAGYFGFADTFDVVISLLQDDSPHVRRAVVEHLPFFDHPRSVHALDRALGDDDVRVRAAAGRALVHLDAASAERLLAQPLRDNDPRVRYQAVQAVGVHKVKSFAPQLRELLAGDIAMPVRIAAAIALGELQDHEAGPLLKEAAQHPEPDLACPAIMALARIPRADARTVFEAALSASDSRRQLAAIEAVAHIPDYLPKLREVASAAGDERIAASALNALARSGDSDSIAHVVALSERDDRRNECINALANAPVSEVAQIGRGLRHRNPAVRRAVVQALGRMRDHAASRELARAVDDPDRSVSFAAQQALGRLDMTTTDSEISPAKSRS